MSTFQALLVLGFPADVAATCSNPEVFAAGDAVTANDLAGLPERRASPAIERVFLSAA